MFVIKWCSVTSFYDDEELLKAMTRSTCGVFLAHYRTVTGMTFLLRSQQVMLFVLLLIGLSYKKVSSSNLSGDLARDNSWRFVGCWPCSRAHLASSYFMQYDSLLDSGLRGYLAQEFGSNDACAGQASSIDSVGLLGLHRELNGEGSHRRLLSTFKFLNQSDIRSSLHAQYCEAVMIERLPIGVFADPFELQHFIHRKVILDAAVFGDKNLELPSALSNRSIVEIHVTIGHENSLKDAETIELPLHARYPPLDASGYAKVVFGRPDLFLRCRSKRLQSDPCFWTLIKLNAGSTEIVKWLVPSGNDAHRGTVSSVTFVSALGCALSIVFSAIYFSRIAVVEGSK